MGLRAHAVVPPSVFIAVRRDAAEEVVYPELSVLHPHLRSFHDRLSLCIPGDDQVERTLIEDCLGRRYC